MSTTRKKTIVHTNITPAQADEAFAGYATASSFIKKKTAEMELHITKVREKYQYDLANQQAILEEKNAILMTYALENESLFEKKKSVEMTHGVIGFRTSTPALKTLKGFTWNSVVNLVREFLPTYVRTVDEVNKELLLAKRDDEEVNKLFTKCGIEVKQTETFFVEVKEETNAAKAVAVMLMLVCMSLFLPAQKTFTAANYDTVIVTPAYTSYFSYHFKNPVVVTYKLYQGGGDCSRKTFRFHNDIPGLPCAHQTDYNHNGYDEGHLCDAADMAYDCTLDESTFRFYNCVPQTPNLNRGSWKHWETIIRKESQTDSLYIEAGSVFSNEFIGDSVYVPALCYKLVGSLSTHKLLHCILCNNTGDAECKEVDYDLLMESLKK